MMYICRLDFSECFIKDDLTVNPDYYKDIEDCVENREWDPC